MTPRNDLFVTIHHEHHPGKPTGSYGAPASASPAPPVPLSAEENLDEDESGAHLLDRRPPPGAALFQSLRAVEVAAFSQRRLVPVTRNRAERRRASGLLTLVEDDESTACRSSPRRELWKQAWA
ncbi:hypothetical protein OG906_08525 [Streptomyces sp. NBC_01426]|uniref:hypothetical protein n=1 Tax=Streptomyces sp. NBC_01426 TaxID=2975866 RepID=UPI002E378320|nr:hypothetical protein [Streptomyces sp. NBC_01426]